MSSFIFETPFIFRVVLVSRYCIDNGGMIAQAGIFVYQMNVITALSDATCTQRYSS